MDAAAAALAKAAEFNDRCGEDAVRMLERADARARAATAKAAGEALLSTLTSCFTELMGPRSQAKDLTARVLEQLSAQKAAAARGDFAADFYPADLVSRVMTSFEAQPFRAEHATQRLRHYFPDSPAAASAYIRDKASMQLVPASTEQQAASSGIATGGASSSGQGVKSAGEEAFARAQQDMIKALAAQMSIFQSNLEQAQRDRAVAVQALLEEPTANNPSDHELAQFQQRSDATQQALDAFVQQHAGTAEIIQYLANTLVPPEPPAPEDLQGAPRLSAAEERRFNSLKGSVFDAAEAQLHALQYRAAWDAYTVPLKQLAALDDRIQQLLSSAMEVNREVTNMQSVSSTAAAAVPAAAKQRVSLVQGFLHPDLGMVMSPNLATYHIIRAVLEGAYEMLGPQDDVAYQTMQPDEGMSLAA
jgi:hypothetical protein